MRLIRGLFSTNGLQARITLVERPKNNGTRWLVPYLELRNVRDLANQMEIQCNSHHLKIELVDANGKSMREGWSLPRSGPVPDLSIPKTAKSLPREMSYEIAEPGCCSERAGCALVQG